MTDSNFKHIQSFLDSIFEDEEAKARLKALGFTPTQQLFINGIIVYALRAYHAELTGEVVGDKSLLGQPVKIDNIIFLDRE